LNHYVGVKVFDMADLDETILWIPALVGSIVLIGVATFLAGWWRRGAVAFLWLIPVGVLADIQFRLYQMVTTWIRRLRSTRAVHAVGGRQGPGLQQRGDDRVAR